MNPTEILSNARAHLFSSGNKQSPKKIEIPFNRPSVEGCELDFLAEAVQSGHLAGDGPFTHRCHAWLESVLGTKRALLTTSCTDALEMMAILLDLKPGDEVIVPSFTFVSTVNAFVLHGVQPVFADIRPDTLNLDETKLKSLITPRTKAIVAVHYAGVACEMDTILEIAREHGLHVLEDNAHGFLGRYKGQFLGTLGRLATLSFHETKNFTCGEGGALLINDERYTERAEIVREKGTNRAGFFRGQVDKYTWMDVGSSFLPSDMIAAFLFAQLLKGQQIQSSRRRIWNFYFNHLQDWARRQQIQLPTVPAYCEHPYHLFYLLTPTLQVREALIAHLKSHGIASAFHYLPLHLSSMGQRLGGRPGSCPVAETVGDRLLRLPFYNSLTEKEQDRVVSVLRDFSA
jgi:dTDP-4-amino-4,6-dideoxygalactose transaminase